MRKGNTAHAQALLGEPTAQGCGEPARLRREPRGLPTAVIKAGLCCQTKGFAFDSEPQGEPFIKQNPTHIKLKTGVKKRQRKMATSIVAVKSLSRVHSLPPHGL